MSEHINRAVAWLLAQQDPSGAFIGFSGEPDPGATIDALLALAATDAAPADAIDRAASYLIANATAVIEQGDGDAAKLLLAMVAANQDPENVAGTNLVQVVTASFDGEAGVCGFGVYDHALCMLALTGAGVAALPAWIETLVSFQIENGGWAFDGSMEAAMADSNTTAIALQALIAAGVTADQTPIQQGLAYLATVKATDGGFAYAVADPLVADANSTGIVVQALVAAGEDPSSAEWGDAVSALAAFQNESGAFRYMHDVPDDNLFATVQAIPALALQPVPVMAG